MHIRTATSADAGAIATIYNPYVADSCVSFETAPVEPADMTGRIDAVLGAGLPWLVAEEDEAIIGYAYATPWKPRQAYRNSVESTIYLARGHTGRGIGNALYGALLDQLRELGLHTAIGGIALPNAASIALHERLGFRNVACFHQVGLKHDRWIDVGYWQLLLQGD